MEIRQFSMHDDYKDINSWFYSRKGEYFPIKFLSQTGFIVPGIAVGFLIKTDANVGILEPFISNPQAPEKERDEALNMILETLCNHARHIGYRAVFGFSTAQTMITRALKQDFEILEINSTTVVKEL